MAATNVLEFKTRLSAAAMKLPENLLGQVVRKVALEALGKIVRRTPVDTGRARGNWQVTTNGAPAVGTVAAVDREGSKTIATGSGEIAKAKPFGVVYLTNNLPYIEPLENGHSKQAPPGGIVAITAQEIQAIFS